MTLKITSVCLQDWQMSWCKERGIKLSTLLQHVVDELIRQNNEYEESPEGTITRIVAAYGKGDMETAMCLLQEYKLSAHSPHGQEPPQ